MLHPNIAVTYRIITIPSPGNALLKRGSSSTNGSGRGAGSLPGSGHNSRNSRNSIGTSRGSGLSARADAFAAASAAAQDAAGPPGAAGRHGQWQRHPHSGSHLSGGQVLGSEAPAGVHSHGGGMSSSPQGASPALTPQGGQQQQQQQRQRARDAVEEAFVRSMSVRIDVDAEIDEDDLMDGGCEILAETWMLMEFCDRWVLERRLWTPHLWSPVASGGCEILVEKCSWNAAPGGLSGGSCQLVQL